MFQVEEDGKIENMTSEEFYAKYGYKVDPIYFKGTYSSHIVTIDNRKLKIIER